MDAYTNRIGFDVLAAPLAEIDRRGLSQAWYSALHLARDARPQTAGLEKTFCRSGSTPKLAALHEPEGTGKMARAQMVALRAPDARRSTAEAVDRRSARLPLAKKIERALMRPRTPARTSAFVLEGTMRVHVAIHASGNRINLVAVCAPQARERVARALDQVRYALAGRGLAVEASLRERVR